MPTDRSVRSIPALPDTQFDYTLTDFKSEFFNSDGMLEWVITAPLLTHNSSAKTAIIELPEIEIEPGQSQWQATARQAIIHRNEDSIELVGNVVIEQPLPSGLRVITTERLHHDRRERTIRATEPVEMRDPNAIIRSGGLVIDLNTDTMEFLNRVQGELFLGDRAFADPASGGERPN